MVISKNHLPTAGIEDVPRELINRICDFANAATLRSLRGTNKACLSPDCCGIALIRTIQLLEASATEALFARVEVYPDAESQWNCTQLLQHDRYRALVRTIAFHTSKNPDAAPWNVYDDLDFDERRIELEPPVDLCEILSQVDRFVSLETLELNFAADCADPADDFWAGQQTSDFRTVVMQNLLAAFVSVNSLTRFHRLRIRNLQDYLPAVAADHPGFANMLGKLDSLSLRVTSETSEATPELELGCAALHSFFNAELKETFLLPIASQLKELKLYTIYIKWGVYPACDFRDLHFPCLEKLALGNYVFAYDWQVDWIVSHKATLKTLVLDNCPITYCGSVGWEEFELEPGAHFTVDETDDRPSKVWFWSARWHTLFDRFKEDLTELRRFTITSHCEDVYGNGAAAFDEGFEDVPGDILNTARYQVQGMGESSILDGETCEREYTDAELSSAHGYTFAAPPPKCYKEDMTALCELLEVIRDRI